MVAALANLHCKRQQQIGIVVQNRNPMVVQACSAGNR
jgi:hypothetical protein